MAKAKAKPTLTIRGKEISVETREMEQSKLRFYEENPRVYSIVRTSTQAPTQAEIYERLLEMEHVKELVQDIRRNQGLLDPVVVKRESHEVLEGNSRLAAYRFLAGKDPIKWGKMKCVILPKGVDESLVFALLGQYHIKGKKDWAPYEQAGFLFRRHKNHNISVEELAEELGLGKSVAARLLETYEFMLTHKERNISRWSYYEEYLKSRIVRKNLRSQYPGMDQLIVKKIRSGEIDKAVDIRDKLKIIAKAPLRLRKRFADGSLDFEDCYERAAEGGSANRIAQRLTKFSQWLANEDTQKEIRGAKDPLRGKLGYEIRKLSRVIGRVKRDLEG